MSFPTSQRESRIISEIVTNPSPFTSDARRQMSISCLAKSLVGNVPCVATCLASSVASAVVTKPSRFTSLSLKFDGDGIHWACNVMLVVAGV